MCLCVRSCSHSSHKQDLPDTNTSPLSTRWAQPTRSAVKTAACLSVPFHVGGSMLGAGKRVAIVIGFWGLRWKDWLETDLIFCHNFGGRGVEPAKSTP